MFGHAEKLNRHPALHKQVSADKALATIQTGGTDVGSILIAEDLERSWPERDQFWSDYNENIDEQVRARQWRVSKLHDICHIAARKLICYNSVSNCRGGARRAAIQALSPNLNNSRVDDTFTNMVTDRSLA